MKKKIDFREQGEVAGGLSLIQEVIKLEKPVVDRERREAISRRGDLFWKHLNILIRIYEKV